MHLRAFALASIVVLAAWSRAAAVPIDAHAINEGSGAKSGLVLAQANPGRDDERARLREELDRLRRNQDGDRPRRQDDDRPRRTRDDLTDPDSPNFRPPLPPRRKVAQPEQGEDTRVVENASSSLDPEIERNLGRLLIFEFSGQRVNDPGVRAVKTLLDTGAISGVVFTARNIESKAAVRETIKFLSQPKGRAQPIIAVRQIGGKDSLFSFEKGFEPWPSAREVASHHNPQYALSTYQTLASNLEFLGFNLNFGPMIAPTDGGAPKENTFADDPLEAAVYAKTFILGHHDSGITAVPILMGGDPQVQTTKSLLVAYPDLSVLTTPRTGITNPVSILFSGPLIRGPRFCNVDVSQTAIDDNVGALFRRDCDVLVFSNANEQPAALRQRISLAVANAVRRDEVSAQDLEAAIKRLSLLRISTTAGSDLPMDERPEASE